MTSTSRYKTIDIITSSYNEEANIIPLYNDLKSNLDKLSKYKWNLIISDNDSTDNTWGEINKLKKSFKNIKAVKLSRNFGFENSILAALHQSDAEIIVIMTSDLQDDASYITQFIDAYESGYDHAYQIVTSRPSVSLLRRINSRLFYKIANYLTNGQIVENVSEFRLITRELKEVLLSMPEQNRFSRGLFSWMGFKSCGIPFARKPRSRGESKAKSLAVVSLAIRGILSHSYVLLDFIAVIGIILSIISFIFFSIFILFWIINGGELYSIGFFATMASFGFGTLLVALGIMSKYISLIYEEVKRRPHYLIKEKI